MNAIFLRWTTVGLAIGVLATAVRVSALDNSKSLNQLNCRTWTRQSGLPMNGVLAMAQTQDGYLWLASQKGMVRFDGFEFTQPNLSIRAEWRNRPFIALRCLSNGELWFGIDSGGFGHWDPDWKFVPPQEEPWMTQDMGVHAILQAKDGAIWIGTGTGIARCFPGNPAATRFYSNAWNARALHEDSAGRMWIGTVDQGVFFWQDGKLTRFADPTLVDHSIFSITSDAQTNLWIGTQFGLRCFDHELKPVTLVPVSYSEVRTVYTDRQGAVWIGTSGEGLGRYFRNNFEMLNRTNGLAHDFVTTLMEDNEGSIWVGTREGISQISDVKFPIYNTEFGLLGGAAHGVFAGRNGGVWIATSRGLSWFDGTNTAQNYSTDAGLGAAYVKRVFESRTGDVYLINASRSIEILSDGKVVARHSFHRWPTALAEDAEGMMASVDSALYRVSRAGVTRLTFKNGSEPPFYWIRNLFTCADGSVLVSTVNGLFRLRNGEVEKHWNVEAGLVQPDVAFACEDEDQTIWIGQRTGMSRLKNDRIVPLRHELADTWVNAIVSDRRGNLWIASTRGIIRLNRRSAHDFADRRTTQLVGTAYDGLDSLKTTDTAEVEFVGCQTQDGHVWFPTPQGALRIDPEHVPVNAMRPPVEIQSVLVNGEAFDPDSITKLKPGRGELVFQFTAPSLLAPQKVRFRYTLDGYDSDWVNAGNRRSALYANLKPGLYVFRVQACNADGLWNEAGDSVAVTLPPHYFQTGWFQLSVAALAISLLAGIYGWRVKHLRRKQLNLQRANELLETKILDRTRELSEQRNLLRTLIDHLPDDVFVKDAEGRVIIDNLAHARLMGLDDPQQAIGRTDSDCFSAQHAEQFRQAEQALLKTGEEYNAEESVVLKNGTPRWQRTTKVALRDSRGEIIGLAGIHRDITEQKKWEAELENLHKQLLDTSRQAGMAEVATSVLHNVGNVLNSVNISASILEEQARNSGIDRLEKVVILLQSNRHNLPAFLTSDDKGGKLVSYLETLYRSMTRERGRAQEEIQSLSKNIEHIKKIVAMQQSYARVAGVIEHVKPKELLEDALRMHEAAYQRHSIRVVREYGETPAISVDRHKVMQILVNLLQNAKYACDVNDAANRVVTLHIGPAGPEKIRMRVTDNGMGIPAENLSRIFSYGFTTRKNGHGFGLHSGALAAREMGGSLSAISEGSGKGASFTLELPIESKTHPAVPPGRSSRLEAASVPV